MWSASVIRFPVAPVAISLSREPAPPRKSAEEQAREQIEAARAEAYRQGFEEASARLSEQMLQQRSDLAHLQQTTFRALAAQDAALFAQAREVLPQLAAEIAQRVLAGFEPDRETVARFAAETLAEIAPGSSEVEVWLCPRDLALVAGLEADFAEKYPGLRFQADGEMRPGDCRARSRFGAIDARLAVKLQNVTRALG